MLAHDLSPRALSDRYDVQIDGARLVPDAVVLSFVADDVDRSGAFLSHGRAYRIDGRADGFGARLCETDILGIAQRLLE